VVSPDVTGLLVTLPRCKCCVFPPLMSSISRLGFLWWSLSVDVAKRAAAGEEVDSNLLNQPFFTHPPQNKYLIVKMESRNLEHRRANFKGKTQFSAQEVRTGSFASFYPLFVVVWIKDLIVAPPTSIFED